MIRLRDFWPVQAPETYKLHFARYNRDEQPLDVFARNREEWRGWQEYWPGRDDFNRPFVFSVMSNYQQPDTWVFGGIWRITSRPHESGDAYGVELSNELEPFIGRLLLAYRYTDRAARVNLERHLDGLEVHSISPTPYQGRAFPGFEDLDVTFAELEVIVRQDRQDWRRPMENAKGIYLISDTLTGRAYVGSAYGEVGLWSRWCNYVSTGHGGNVELRQLVTDPSLAYCRKAFRFSVLEHHTSRASDELVLSRESRWKRVLMTRGPGGYNRN